jgi:hypothetical protein
MRKEREGQTDRQTDTRALICGEQHTYHDVLYNKGGILFFVPFKL